jgi:hypothetical protein
MAYQDPNLDPNRRLPIESDALPWSAGAVVALIVVIAVAYSMSYRENVPTASNPQVTMSPPATTGSGSTGRIDRAIPPINPTGSDTTDR